MTHKEKIRAAMEAHDDEALEDALAAFVAEVVHRPGKDQKKQEALRLLKKREGQE